MIGFAVGVVTHILLMLMRVARAEAVIYAEAKRQKKLRKSSMHRRQGGGKYTSFQHLMARDADVLNVNLKAFRIGITALTAGQEWKA
jgi:hypothetical protein